MDDATDGEVWELAAYKAVSDMERGCESRDGFWQDLGVDRADVVQEALVRSWRAFGQHDGRGEVVLHCYCAAKYGVKDHLRENARQVGCERRVDRFLAGLEDDEHEIEYRVRTMAFSSLSTEDREEVQGRVEPDVEVSVSDLRAVLDSAAACLDERERRIVFVSYGIREVPRSLGELAEEFGITERRVRQIRDEAIEKMQAELRADAILGRNPERHLQ